MFHIVQFQPNPGKNFVGVAKSFKLACSVDGGKNCLIYSCNNMIFAAVKNLLPNSDLAQISHCHIKGLSVREVMRTENMITQVKFSW